MSAHLSPSPGLPTSSQLPIVNGTSSTKTPFNTTESPDITSNPVDTTPTDPKWNSPGNAHRINSSTPPMKLPNLSFLYRLECDIAKEDIEVGAPYGAGIIRSIANIVGGEVRGPKVNGTVLQAGAADWATVIEGTHSMTLDARYTIHTHDNHHIFIQAHGLYRPGPGTAYSSAVNVNPSLPPQHTVTQEDIEFFSHLRLEAGGDTPYNWVNGLVCIGVMCCVGTRIVIDVYYLTNFLGREPEDVRVRCVERGVKEG